MPAITGTNGNDTLSDTQNNDVINALGGDDVVIWLEGGNDVFDGGDGRDLLMIRLDSHPFGDKETLVFNAASGTAQLTFSTQFFTNQMTLSFSNFEDYLIIVRGVATNDRVDTAGGNDTVDLQFSGQDQVNLGAGFDTLKLDGLTSFDASGFASDANGYFGSVVSGANRLDFTGADSFWLVGTSGSDHLIGSAHADSLDGLAGADTLEGGLGDDTYYVDSISDVVVEGANAGNDTIVLNLPFNTPSPFSYSLAGMPNVENLELVYGDPAARLTGNDADNIIVGAFGDDLLVGLGGADTLAGGGGNDAYLLSDGLDTIIEAVGAGNDTVYTTASYRLTPGAEVETLTVYDRSTTDAINLTGNEFGQTIIGDAGPNLLAGLGGVDTLYGLGGDDAYLIEDADKVVEAVGGGNDTIYTTISYTLDPDSEIEVLTAYDRTTTDAMNLTGNRFDNTIYGTNGVNALVGGGGTDTLYGLGGDDSYLVDSSGDKVFEFAGGGNDTVYTTASYTLDPTAEVEVLTAYDRSSFDPLALTGNGFANTIYGTAGGNAIDGKGGADTIYGMGGADSIVFSTPIGPGTGNVDTLVGFQTGIGRLLLDDSVFTGLPLGQLAPGAFVQGTQANDADDRIIYDPSTGALYFDADGNGPGAAVQFATLVQGAVAASDIFIVTGHA